jgi:hypothetical protein
LDSLAGIPDNFRGSLVRRIQPLIGHPKAGNGADVHALLTKAATIHMDLNLFFFRKMFYGVGGTYPETELTADAGLSVVPDTPSKILRNYHRRVERKISPLRCLQSIRQAIR